MPYSIKIKGRREAITVSDTVGARLTTKWLDGSLPERVQLTSEITVRSAQIDSIEHEQPKVYADRQVPDLTPEERQRNLERLAEMRRALWGAVTGGDTGHYTEAHRLKRCTCFRPEDWQCPEHSVRYATCGCTPADDLHH